eukprot:jgi/Ulvmu1/1283/UM011_0007.1
MFKLESFCKTRISCFQNALFLNSKYLLRHNMLGSRFGDVSYTVPRSGSGMCVTTVMNIFHNACSCLVAAHALWRACLGSSVKENAHSRQQSSKAVNVLFSV